MIEAFGFPDPEWYDEGRTRKIVAGGQVLWATKSCVLAGPCGKCEEFCPTGVLQLSGALSGVSDPVCIRCRLCLVTCPVGALAFVPSATVREKVVVPSDALFK